MRLNMTILKDRLEGLMPIGSKLGETYALPLEGCCVWRSGSEPSAAHALIVEPADLPPLPGSGQLCLLCAGRLPDSYRKSNHVLFIEFPPETSSLDMLDRAGRVFSELSDWDMRMRSAALEHRPLDEIAAIAHEQLINNFCCYDAQNYMLFFEHVPDDPYVSLYPDPHTYLSEAESEALTSVDAYGTAFTEKHPTMFRYDGYDADSLVSNIYDGDALVARLSLDITQRPVQKSDYVLLHYINGIIREVLLQWNLLRIGSDEEFDAMLVSLVEQGSGFESEHERVLANAGWNRDDVYRCMTIVPREGRFDSSTISQSALFVQRHLENCFTSGNDRRLLVVVNSDRRRGKPEPDEELDRFLRFNDYICGVSREFRGFDRVRTFFRQSWQTLEAGRSSGYAGPAFHFDEFALDIMLKNSTGDFSSEDYIIPQLHAVVAYDREHDGELMQTLVTYIKGSMNVTAAVNRLHVHKTTFYYRLRRIEEIGGLSLDDYRTVLYLMMIFETVDEFRALSLA